MSLLPPPVALLALALPMLLLAIAMNGAAMAMATAHASLLGAICTRIKSLGDYSWHNLSSKVKIAN
jgi:hypothetical protein